MKPLCQNPTPRTVASLLASFALLVLFGLAGCDDTERTSVDFSTTQGADNASSQMLSKDESVLRAAVASMISPAETYNSYLDLFRYISTKAGHELEFVQRKTYAEINELLAAGKLDIAWICTGPYALDKTRYGFKLLAAPQLRGEHVYHSNLLVRKNTPYQSLDDLRGHSFAFTDPSSNSGYLAPLNWLHTIGEEPSTFFSRTIFTYSHDNSILAVAKGLVDAAAVDSLVWEYFQQVEPDLTSQIRIIRTSQPFATPPIVGSPALKPAEADEIQSILVSMHESEEGRSILNSLLIDRFIAAEDSWYDPVRNLYKEMTAHE